MKHKATTAGTTRIVFLDYLRVLACLMVIATHSCDSFYIGPGGVWQCAVFLSAAGRGKRAHGQCAC